MPEKLEKETVFYRKKAGELIKCVLAKRMPVKQALLAFPKDVSDESVRASWHALCHLEADEDLRKKESDYAEEQDLYLRDIAETLGAGKALPSDIIECYKEYYDMPLTPHRTGWKGFIASFNNFLNIKK